LTTSSPLTRSCLPKDFSESSDFLKNFIIATKNKGKLNEFSRILEPLDINCITADIPDVEENGKSFEENAYIKAYHAYKATGLPSIGDDSGLEVDALNGHPGIFSARYSGINSTDSANIEKLLKNMDGITDRSARFVCAICCVLSETEKIIVRETCEGDISKNPLGENGFGYDSVFICQTGKTFAQESDNLKDEISHRGKALRELYEKLSEREKLNDNK